MPPRNPRNKYEHTDARTMTEVITLDDLEAIMEEITDHSERINAVIATARGANKSEIEISYYASLIRALKGFRAAAKGISSRKN